MRHLSIPIMTDTGLDVEKQIEIIKKINPDRVFLAMGRYKWKRDVEREEIIKRLTTMRERFEGEGYETGVWISTFGYGGKMEKRIKKSAENIIPKRSIIGNECEDAVCPLNLDVQRGVCELLEDLAKTGTKMIMLDDEYVLSIVPGIGCFCDLHMAKYREVLGENITREELARKIFAGGKNKYRDAWYRINGDTLRDFSKLLRKTLDNIDKTIRLGFCSGVTSWDFEGADAIELSYILAGETKPFLRMTGAPYWYAAKRFGFQQLQSIAEITRQQIHWCKEHSDIELFSENDTYPRVRYNVPAAYVELFDQMMIVSENPGTLKYVVDYNNNPDYEAGYINAHLRNLKLAKELTEMFADKRAIGIKIYESMRTIQNADLPDAFCGEDITMYRWLRQSSQIPTANAIPTTYDEGICGMVFGENTKYLPETAFDTGLVLDVKAAEILKNRGVDTGLVSRAKINESIKERFGEEGDTPNLYAFTGAYAMEISEKARVLSVYEGEKHNYPAVYLYENAKGQRFMVYGFSIEETLPNAGILLSYSRGKQLNDAIEFLGGKKMPVVCNNQPMLYCVCKTNDKALAAAYFNCHADEKEKVEITLDFKPRSIRFLNCTGACKNDKVVIDYIAPYKVAAFEAEY